MSPEWRQIKRLLNRVHADIEKSLAEPEQAEHPELSEHAEMFTDHEQPKPPQLDA